MSGKIIADSKGLNQGKYVCKESLTVPENQPIIHVFRNKQTNENLMSAYAAIKIDHKVIGILRFLTSIEKIDIRLNYLIYISLMISSAVIFTLSLLSIFFTKSILDPIKEINAVAKKMAKGEFDTKIQKNYNDEIGQLADTLNYMSGEILKMQNLKNEFISSISHELRTPLTSIKGWSETIATSGLNDTDEIKTGLRIISKEVDRLSQMVDNLLDFSKLESGKLNLNFEWFDFIDIIEEIWCLYKTKAHAKELHWSLQLNDGIKNIYGDKCRFRQIVINILDNAIKFSKPNGNISIAVSKEDKIKIMVQDDGIGIPKDKIEKVKEKFYKIDVHKEGSGLGLAICQELIQLHGWNLAIESSEGLGTKVIIEIPDFVENAKLDF
ncbi:sensor histidine kinase [Thermotalea metallivorans]|uniref:sensor histidine kinase n=1 Tax=Thermotalea metallivorans TaxID=520762 RepID=UPI0018DB0982|nr:HAMP domain-containing sensor histidine kinase [Thermotalea metallivorans]